MSVYARLEVSARSLEYWGAGGVPLPQSVRPLILWHNNYHHNNITLFRFLDDDYHSVLLSLSV